MKKLFIYPLFIIVSLVLHFSFARAGIDLTAIPSIVFAIMVMVMIAFERMTPYRKDWNENLGDFKADIIQTLVVLPFVAKIIELAFRYLHKNLNIKPILHDYPFWVQAIIIILFAEFLFYWYHRISHTNKFLLRYHAVHHGALRVYWGNAGRFHFVDLFFQFALYFIPVYLLSGNEEVASLFLTLNAITGTLEHANIDAKTILMSRIFNTAELHRIHHSTKPAECNSNYGKILSFWDIVFGTYQKPKFKRETLKVGLPGGRPVPHHVWGQIMYPFAKKAPSPSNKPD